MMFFLHFLFRLFRLPPIFVTNFFSFGKRKSLKIFRLNKQNKGRAFSHPREKTPNFYSSPIQTILSVSESHRILRQSARRLYCRSGISPCPEEFHISFAVKKLSRFFLRKYYQKNRLYFMQNNSFFAAHSAFWKKAHGSPWA